MPIQSPSGQVPRDALNVHLKGQLFSAQLSQPEQILERVISKLQALKIAQAELARAKAAKEAQEEIKRRKEVGMRHAVCSVYPHPHSARIPMNTSLTHSLARQTNNICLCDKPTNRPTNRPPKQSTTHAARGAPPIR